ncbi:unnamed protein product [Notodromas monacha]|uniref:Ion transport domain-containing protein n=1 Tax=Notodromas monacha TaxID=399045 RepID=A0A7R9BI70_9CRUS|nr:unnamed protein product [Notodromas monacha]CAG0915102.1 unnamed protein product [Notodromas monacha]
MQPASVRTDESSLRKRLSGPTSVDDDGELIGTSKIAPYHEPQPSVMSVTRPKPRPRPAERPDDLTPKNSSRFKQKTRFSTLPMVSFLGLGSHSTDDGLRLGSVSSYASSKQAYSKTDLGPATIGSGLGSKFVPRRRGVRDHRLGFMSSSKMEARMMVLEEDFVKVILRRWTPLDDDALETEVKTSASQSAVRQDSKKRNEIGRRLLGVFIVIPALMIVVQGELGMKLFATDEKKRHQWQLFIDRFDLVYTILHAIEYSLVVGLFFWNRKLQKLRQTMNEDQFQAYKQERSGRFSTFMIETSETVSRFGNHVFVFERSYDKLMHAILKPMVTYFFPLMVLLLFLITISALIGHFLFGFHAANENPEMDSIADWITIQKSFMSVLDFFLGDQWGDVYETQSRRPSNQNNTGKQLVVGLFVVVSVVGLGIIYAAVFIAVLIFKVGELNEEEVESNEREEQRRKIEKRLEEYEESQRYMLHLLEAGRLKTLSDLLEQQMYRSFKFLELVVKDRPRTTKLWMEGFVTSLNWLTATHRHLLAIYHYMEATMDEADRIALQIVPSPTRMNRMNVRRSLHGQQQFEGEDFEEH